MALYALHYRYVDDPNTVSTYRPKHREYLTTLVERGELLACGPLGDPGPAGGLLIFDVESLDRMKEIARDDPFTHHGVIENQSIQSWSLFIGADLFATRS